MKLTKMGTDYVTISEENIDDPEFPECTSDCMTREFRKAILEAQNK
jgi:hypothetical protein